MEFFQNKTPFVFLFFEINPLLLQLAWNIEKWTCMGPTFEVGPKIGPGFLILHEPNLNWIVWAVVSEPNFGSAARGPKHTK